jgi:hypothetical protein
MNDFSRPKPTPRLLVSKAVILEIYGFVLQRCNVYDNVICSDRRPKRLVFRAMHRDEHLDEEIV